ncbi:MAG: SpoIIE family protein phosphatase [Bacteroidales bacterium]|nr:SpoIIE family protein phosphatase [Bacteroidales bacterium]
MWIIIALIAAAASAAVAIAYFTKYKNLKSQTEILQHQKTDLEKAGKEMEGRLAEQEKAASELKTAASELKKAASELEDKNENLTAENDSLKAEMQQTRAAMDGLAAENSAQRQKMDAAKLRMVDMLKHLQALQRTTMTDTGQIKAMFADFFVLYRPWDAVGGDFYKFIRKGDTTLVACGNCGQSGISGLTKGLLNIVFLQEIVERGNLATMEAGQILDSLRSKYGHLAERNEQYRYDEDIPVNFSLCIINEKQRSLNYAGAYGSVCLIRKSYPGTSRKENDLHEFRGDRMNFAVSFGRRKNYSTEFIELEKDDRLYMKTDGYVNQRGGTNNDRFGDIYLRQLMMKHANEPMIEQKAAYEQEFLNWKGENAKGNDILIIGLALKVAGK